MARNTSSSPKPLDNAAPADDASEKAREAAVQKALKDNPEVAAELDGLTIGEQIIRLRQRGLLDFDVQ